MCIPANIQISDVFLQGCNVVVTNTLTLDANTGLISVYCDRDVRQ